MSISARLQSALLVAGIAAGVISAIAPAQAYWGGYGYYGYQPYYAPPPPYYAPPAYYQPYYRPRVVYMPPPASIIPHPVYVAPRAVAARSRVTRRPIHHAIVRIPPSRTSRPTAPGPAFHSTPRRGDLPSQGSTGSAATPAAVSPGSLPWVPKTGMPASAPTPVLTPAPATPTPPSPAPAISPPTFTPMNGED